MRQTWGHIRELVAYALNTLPGHSWKLPAVAMLGLAELALAVLSPLLTLQIINSLVTGELAQFRGALLKLGLCLCGQAIVNVSHQMAMLILDENVGTGMRKQTLQFVLSQPAAFFDRYWAGDLMARVLNDCTALKGVLSAVLLRLVYDGLTIIVVLAIMVRMNPILGLLSFAASPAAILFGRWIRPKIEQASRAVRDRAGDITANLQSWLVDSLALKAFCVEHTAEAQFAEHNYRLRDAGVRAGILGSCASFANFFLVGIPSLLIFGYGGGQVLKGGLTVGELFAFMTYCTYFNAPLQRLVSLALVAVPAQIALLHRIQEVTGSTQGSSPLLLAAPRALSLKIRDLRVELSSGFTLTVPSFDGHAGEIVGVTGPNGSGKSTLIRTILGVQPADSGSLEFESAGGQRVEEAIRRGFVPQKAILFPGTVLDNVTLFDAKPDIERATECLKWVGLSAWLASLPGRIEEKSLGNGKMSGGQLQRLNLARVLYSRAGITLLDEPGNNLDDQVETELIPILRSIAARGTVIVTTHSPAVLAHCDRVYRMTHAERGQNAASCSISHDFAQIGVH